MERNFKQLLENQWAEGKFVCVGLDSDFEKIPGARIGGVMQTILGFNRRIVEATSHLVCAYKPNVGFYGAYGNVGWLALRETVAYIRKVAPEVPVILDSDYGSIRNIFGFLDVDAVTVNPYLGGKALKPFLDCKDKGIIVLCRTSNPGADEFQDLWIGESNPLYLKVASNVAKYWNKNGNCGVEVSAAAPHELQEIRDIVGDMLILITDVGPQNGDVEKAVLAGKDSRDRGMIISSALNIIFADDPRRETYRLHEQISGCLAPIEM